MQILKQISAASWGVQQILSAGQSHCQADSLLRTYQAKLPTTRNSTTFPWETITPSRHLKYHDCYDGYQCARLEVPMDWNRADGNGSKVAIAVLRLPAKVPVTDKRYGGPMITNPGGPGGSGVSFTLKYGKRLQKVIDEPADPGDHASNGLYYDVVSFDPRSVGYTTPQFSCYGKGFARKAWEVVTQALPLPGNGHEALSQHWFRSNAYWHGCMENSKTSEDEENILNHLNTAPVARDIVEIVEQHGVWREKEAARLMQHADCEDDRTIIEKTKHRKGAEGIQYWGFSYGTILGATMAAMFPDQVKRVVLDGVVDIDDYYQCHWAKNIQDSDAAFEEFFKHCAAAGPDKCPFWHEGGPEVMRSIYDSLLDVVRTDPIPVVSRTTPAFVTTSFMQRYILDSLYNPLLRFPIIAEILSGLIKGNTTRAEMEMLDYLTPLCPEQHCTNSTDVSSGCVGSWQSDDPSRSILCTDSDGRAQFNLSSFEEHWHQQRNISKTVGDAWALSPLACVKFDAKPAWPFRDIRANTSNPLLFIGNTFDPVTPLRNAFAVSTRFPGSSVLHQDSGGHCSTIVPSLCSAKTIRAYFQTGELPEMGKFCPVDEVPFQKVNASVISTLDVKDRELWNALQELKHANFKLGGL